MAICPRVTPQRICGRYFAEAIKLLPAKTLSFMSCLGTLIVIFATEPKITFWSVGATCLAICSLCVTMCIRAPVDEDIVATFSPIMLGTLRQKMRSLHVILQCFGVGFAYLGAIFITVARVREGHNYGAALFSSPAGIGEGLGVNPHDTFGLIALALLTVQIVTTGAGDDSEEAIGHFAHDAVCITQILTLLSKGVSSMSSTLVAVSTLALWLSTAIQVHVLHGGPPQGSEDLSKYQQQETSAGPKISFAV